VPIVPSRDDYERVALDRAARPVTNRFDERQRITTLSSVSRASDWPQKVDLSGNDRGPRGGHAAIENTRVDQRNQRGKGAETCAINADSSDPTGDGDIHTAGVTGSIPVSPTEISLI
jgi:hypothetical protein